MANKAKRACPCDGRNLEQRSGFINGANDHGAINTIGFDHIADVLKVLCVVSKADALAMSSPLPAPARRVFWVYCTELNDGAYFYYV